MKKISVLIVLGIVAMMVAAASIAVAGSGHHGGSCPYTAADSDEKPACPVTGATEGECPKTGKDCGHCEVKCDHHVTDQCPHTSKDTSSHESAVCPHCAKADCPHSKDCCAAKEGGCPMMAKTSNLPDWHVASPEDLNVSMQQLDGFTAVWTETNLDGVADAFNQMMVSAHQQGLIADDSMVMSIYDIDFSEADEHGEDMTFKAAYTVADDAVIPEGYEATSFDGGNYMVVEHWGPYEELHSTYEKVMNWADEADITFADDPVFEVYITDPMSVDNEDELLTEIYFPFEHTTGMTSEA